MRKARRFISREKQVFLLGFSLTFPRFRESQKIDKILVCFFFFCFSFINEKVAARLQCLIMDSHFQNKFQ